LNQQKKRAQKTFIGKPSSQKLINDSGPMSALTGGDRLALNRSISAVNRSNQHLPSLASID